MRKVFLYLVLTGLMVPAVAQKNNSGRFRMPALARYLPGHVLVKAKTGFDAGSLGARVSNTSIQSVAPLVQPKLSKKGASWRGPRAVQPIVDITRYYTIQFDPGTPVEDFINQLYATGNFEIVEPEYAYETSFSPNDPSLSTQYYLSTIHALEAWDITQGTDQMTIAIVDTGGDLDHPDLVDNLYVNTNEIPNNNIDDDGDGLIDNYRGWDFIGNDTLNIANPNFIGDNNPSVTAGGDLSHGTWAAGCASARANNATGIAGVGFRTKLMFTKHTADNQKTTNGNIYFGYKGILYAANQGVKIINCSWGGTSYSQVFQDVINHVTLDLGCLVVAAAGNAGNNVPSYPASYDHVLSVAATDANDLKAVFSSFGPSVDISAPGVGIYTTSFNNGYRFIDGTSFSSPMTAGAAALVWSKNPAFTPDQVAEQLRVTANEEALDATNPGFIHQLGKGRLDVQRALTLELPSVRASNPKLVNANGQVLKAGESGYLILTLTNFLKSTSSGIQVTISTASPDISITKNAVSPGIIGTSSTITTVLNPFELSIAANTPENTTVNFQIHIADGNYTDDQFFAFLINPSFLDVNSNLVNTTISAIGRIGYQDPANSAQGSGFVFNEQSLLFEMGLMMGTSATNLYNNVRGINNGYNQDFFSTIKISQEMPGQRSFAEIAGAFSNSTLPAQQALIVNYRSLVWKDAPYDKFVILEYTIRNSAAGPLNQFYFGLFADWDITGDNDAANWFDAEKLGYVYPAQPSPKPHAGIQLLTGPSKYYAIDNDQAIGGNPFGLYDGYTDAEKFTSLSTQRLTAGLFTPEGTDVSHVVASGPYDIPAGNEIRIAFAIHSAANLADLKTSAAYADSMYNFTLHAPRPVVDTITVCYNSAATITATGASQLKWYKTFTGGSSFFSGSQFVTGPLTADTIFYVSNAEHTYESVRTPAVVRLKANPTITTSGSTTLCEGQFVTLSVHEADSYLWSTTETTRSIVVTTAGDYSVQVSSTTPPCTTESEIVPVVVNPIPHAEFEITGDSKIFSPQVFTDQSTDANSWYWEFGDGGTSTDQNTTHTYDEINDETVVLTVTGSNGCQDSASHSISVITGLPDPGEGLTIHPNPLRGGILKVEWSESLPGTVSLSTTLGQLIYKTEFQPENGKVEQEIPVQNLVAGMYLLRVSAGDRTAVRKVVKVD